MNEPRVYRNSPFLFWFLVLVFGILFVSVFFSIGFTNPIVLLPIALLFGVVFLFILFSTTSQTIISNDEISVKNLFGTKTLRWSEINRISGRGYGIKLHNFDGDVTVAPSTQLPGYNEVIEWIGVKRPDLFNPQEYSEFSKSWLSTILLPILGFVFIGLGFFVLTQSGDTFISFLMLIITGVVFISITLTSPQAVVIQGNSMVIGYLFNQKTLLANEIASIVLRYTQSRNGKNYFVAVNLVSRKTIRISGLRPNLPVVYLVLKNWHKKNAAIGLTNQ